ncbi:hypothetical protein [Litoreibacter roseus]|uniref:Flp pilus assembly pilin Flp n=1 Tax=Litoreibacter roseus TaxID=2601869 RepID=A0A6N6JHU7_9RHOB|nr:hypothetical protein [Litoreibacter roseus]GFE65410.1 hypothetical protein KIN_24840 [Litoreibacter roseus]
MKRFITSFLACEDGAVTVDWIILTTGVVSLAVASAAIVLNGTQDVSQTLNEGLIDIEVRASGDDGAGTTSSPGL